MGQKDDRMELRNPQGSELWTLDLGCLSNSKLWGHRWRLSVLMLQGAKASLQEGSSDS